MPPFEALQRELGYTFRESGLLRTALTHRSHSSPHNERLEFLGDSLLNCVIADQLYLRFPESPEGDLSRQRALLVRQDALHKLALQLKLGEHLLLGEGELKSGGHQRPSILADALEAIFGAIFLDSDFVACAEVIKRLYGDEAFRELPSGQQMKDAKTRLQERLQSQRIALPQYLLLGTTGEAHAQCFEMACDIPSLRLRTTGSGTSRRLAEQAAAEAALTRLENTPTPTIRHKKGKQHAGK
jgi:ribonuclease-3